MKAKGISMIKYILVLIGVCFIFIGLIRGEQKSVLTKATAVCLECIGIG